MNPQQSGAGLFQTWHGYKAPDGTWDGSVIAGDDTDIPLPIATPTSGATSWTITPSGGVTFTGSVAEVRGKILAASGGVTVAGATGLLRGRVYVPANGVVIGGTAPGSFSGTRIITPTGGVVFGGSSALLFTSLGSQRSNSVKHIQGRVMGHRGFELWRMALARRALLPG